MHIPKSLVIVLIFALYTVSAVCPNQCSKRGRCTNDKCICPNGWYTEDCSQNIIDVLPGPVMAFRVINGIFFLIAFLLSVVIAIAKKRSQQLNTQKLGFRSQNVILGFVAYLSLTNFLMHAFDPFAMLGTYPYYFYRFMFASIFPALLSLFSVIIFHWANMYHTSMKMLKDNENLKKINRNYKGDITIQEVIERGAKNVKILTYIKVFLVILNILTWLLQLIREILLAKKIVTMKTTEMQVFWLTWLVFVYAITTAGIIYYTPRLLSIMPDQIMKKMKRITRTMIIMSVLFICSAIIITATMARPVPDPRSFIAGDWCFRTAILVILYTMISFFMKPHRKFPYFIIANSFRSSKSNGSASADIGFSTTASEAVAGTEFEVVVSNDSVAAASQS